jgi:hypothetical protein
VDDRERVALGVIVRVPVAAVDADAEGEPEVQALVDGLPLAASLTRKTVWPGEWPKAGMPVMPGETSAPGAKRRMRP